MSLDRRKTARIYGRLWLAVVRTRSRSGRGATGKWRATQTQAGREALLLPPRPCGAPPVVRAVPLRPRFSSLAAPRRGLLLLWERALRGDIGRRNGSTAGRRTQGSSI